MDTREKFGPYAEMTEEVRETFCNWWWSEANDIIHRRGLTRDDIRRAAHMSDTVLRPGFAELVKQCNDKGVPFVIVSAGFADVIEGILEREGIDTSHCVVHANRCGAPCPHFRKREKISLFHRIILFVFIALVVA